MIESVLFKKVDIVFPTDIFSGDVLVENGKIVEIGPSISKEAELVIKDTGLTLMAGVIDPHVHFRDPGATHKEDIASGSTAAAAGGVTTFFDMPNTSPSTTSIAEMEKKKAHAALNSLVNYNFFIGATQNNLDDLKRVTNVPGIKIYVGSSTGTLLVNQYENLNRIFEETHHIIAVHSEDEEMIQERLEKYKGSNNILDHEKIRSAEGAVKCTKMLIQLAQRHQHRLHICHLTTSDEVDILRQLGNQQLITSEVTPQHLLTYAPDIYDQWGTKAQINPPIRHRNHQEGLMKGLLDKVIDCMGSDHAPHLDEEKNQPFGKAPSGMPGVETSLPLMLNLVHDGLIDILDVTRLMSVMPAKIYSVQNKGQIKVGYDADFVLLDRKSSYSISKSNLFTKCNWSIFEDQKIHGKVIATFVNGQCVFREGDVNSAIKGKEAICGLTESI